MKLAITLVKQIKIECKRFLSLLLVKFPYVLYSMFRWGTKTAKNRISFWISIVFEDSNTL